MRWAVARSLLEQGLTEPAGEGDIRFWPSIDEDLQAVVCMDFHSPEGRLVTSALTSDLQHFLARTCEVVASGEEDERIDIDLLVQSLIGAH